MRHSSERRGPCMIMRSIVLVAAAVLAVVTDARAQIAVSANDNKVLLDNGVVKVVPNAPPDTVSIIDLSARPPPVIAEVQAPVGVVAPPLNPPLPPDESLAPLPPS